MVVGTSSGVGKTTITRGIIACLKRRGLSVQSYKLGPDYIDAGHHAALTGRPCINLDPFLLTPAGEESSFASVLLEELGEAASGADALIVEAVGGLFDDWARDGTSPAGIAKALGVPVLLVADGSASCQTLGLTINALLGHDLHLRAAGVVVTKVNSPEHYARIVETVLPKYRELLLGFIPARRELYIEERHLGLTTSAEIGERPRDQRAWADVFEANLDLSKILSLRSTIVQGASRPASPHQTCCIGVAYDRAFSFYYDYNLRCLERLGAELRYLSPLADSEIPKDLDALYLGGGFPEIHAEGLSANTPFLLGLRSKIEAGLPVYAECGGLIYLARRIQHPSTLQLHDAVGVFPCDALFSSCLRLAYTWSTAVTPCLVARPGGRFKGHVFHRTRLSAPMSESACVEIRSTGDSKAASPTYGYCYKNVYASYAHAHFRSADQVASRFVAAATAHRASREC